MTLRDALETQVHIKAVEGDLEALRPIVEAARRVAEAPEVEWCEAHGHSIANYWEKRCEAASDDKPCRMVRKLLVDPPEEDRE